MTWRAVGCVGIGAAAFVALGLLALSMTLAPGGCLARLQWSDTAYRAEGTPAPEPRVGDDPAAVIIGQTFQGLTTRDVYAAPGSTPSDDGALPERIAVDCGDGSYQAYLREP